MIIGFKILLNFAYLCFSQKCSINNEFRQKCGQKNVVLKDIDGRRSAKPVARKLKIEKNPKRAHLKSSVWNFKKSSAWKRWVFALKFYTAVSMLHARNLHTQTINNKRVVNRWTIASMVFSFYGGRVEVSRSESMVKRNLPVSDDRSITVEVLFLFLMTFAENIISHVRLFDSHCDKCWF